MTRRGSSRLPGDPRTGDGEFGALGGFVDDVFFWVRNRERGRELEADRLASASRGAGSVRERRSRFSAWLRSLGRPRRNSR